MQARALQETAVTKQEKEMLKRESDTQTGEQINIRKEADLSVVQCLLHMMLYLYHTQIINYLS